MTPVKLAFLLGMMVGGLIGFSAAAFLAVSGMEDIDE